MFGRSKKGPGYQGSAAEYQSLIGKMKDENAKMAEKASKLSPAQMLELIEKQAEKGSLPSRHKLANIYTTGTLPLNMGKLYVVGVDLEKALLLTKKNIEDKLPGAEIDAARICLLLNEADQHSYWVKRALEEGSYAAMFWQARMYYYGIGVGADAGKAVSLLKDCLDRCKKDSKYGATSPAAQRFQGLSFFESTNMVITAAEALLWKINQEKGIAIPAGILDEQCKKSFEQIGKWEEHSWIEPVYRQYVFAQKREKDYSAGVSKKLGEFVYRDDLKDSLVY